MEQTRSLENGSNVGACQQCYRFGEVVTTLQGWSYCPRCALQSRFRRMLPGPPPVVVRCLGFSAMLAISVYLLILGYTTGVTSYAAAAFLAGLFSIIILGLTCLRVVYCLNRAERVFLRREMATLRTTHYS